MEPHLPESSLPKIWLTNLKREYQARQGTWSMLIERNWTPLHICDADGQGNEQP
jgi:hypothetical protein